MEINSYEGIIKRIADIINLSKGSNNTKRICFFDIDEAYYNEFDNLIKTELTWFEMQNNVEKYINNNIALKFEADKIKNNNNAKIVEELINIIDSTSGLHPCDLEIIESYIIKRELARDFHVITKQLHIGPYIPLTLSVEKDDNRLKDLINAGKVQFERINNKLPHKEELPVDNKKIIDSEYEYFICLANRGLLNKDAIIFLSTVFDDIKYLALLNDLKKYLAISESEYNDYYTLRSGKPVFVNSVDQLTEYFKSQKNLTIKGLMSLRDSIGELELDKLIFELVKEGVFSTTEYLEQYLGIETDTVTL